MHIPESELKAMNTPGEHFLNASKSEQIRLVQGYIVAMEAVTTSLGQLRSVFAEGRQTGRMSDADIGCLVPEYLTELLNAWSFEEAEMAAVVAYTIAIYREQENTEIGLASILEIARDLSLRRITDGQARERLAELRRG